MTRRPLRIIALLGIALALVLALADRAKPGGRPIVKVTGVDAVCYFSVAHSLLFDRDLDLGNQYRTLLAEKGLTSKWFATVPATGRPASPFAIGYSLLALPFLAVGHAADALAGGQADGYSRPAIWGFFLANLFYLTLGLAFLYLFYRNAGGGSVGPALLGTLVLWPATTLAYYSFSPMSHVASFFATSLFLWTFWRTKDHPGALRWLGFGAATGLMFLARWQDVIFGLIPLGFEIDRLRRARPRFPPAVLKARLAYLAAFALTVTPQLVEWKAIFGSAFTVPQGAGFFEFPPRHALHVLLSSNHGWFTWTPITLLGVAGLVAGLRRQRLLAGGALAAIALQVVLIGSLSFSWNGQESFGMRMLTSAVPLMGLGLVFLLSDPRARVRRGTLIAAAAATVWALAFGVQYRLDMVPKNDRLTASELLLDKIAVKRAWSRRKMAVAAEEHLEGGQPDRARETAAAAIERYGASDRLHRAIVEATAKLGDRAAEQSAKEAHDQFRNSLLF